MDPKLAYLQNQVNSATPLGLLILLHEGLINFAHKAKESFIEANDESRIAGAEAVNRCIRIVRMNHNVTFRVANTGQVVHGTVRIHREFIGKFSVGIAIPK